MYLTSFINLIHHKKFLQKELSMSNEDSAHLIALVKMAVGKDIINTFFMKPSKKKPFFGRPQNHHYPL